MPSAPLPGASVASGARAGRDSATVRNLRTAGMIWRRDLIRLRRNSVRIMFGLAQPLGFLIVFSVGLAPVIGASALPQHAPYRVYIFPGILAMSVISSALISTVSIVWDREFGFMREMLVAPVSRSALIAGKTLGGGSIAMSQGLLLLLLAPAGGVHLTPARVVTLLAALLLMALTVTAVGIVLASSVDRMQTLQTVMTLVTQPMIFTSGALFPVTNLPTWLAVVCFLNPVTYGVDLARRALLGRGAAIAIGSWTVPIWFDLLVMLAMGALMLTFATRRVVRIE